MFRKIVINYQLRQAIIEKNSTTVDLLISKGADVNPKDNQDGTLIELALQQAHDKNRTAILRSLISAGACLPNNKTNLRFLLISQPPTGAIEYFDQTQNKFILVDEL